MEKRTITNVLYVAFDGKQFKDEHECLLYEYRHKLNDFLNSKNTRHFEDLDDYPYPTDENYNRENWNYYYIKILNKKGLEELHEFIKFLPTGINPYHYSTPQIGQIICIMESTFNNCETTIISLDKITNEIQDFYKNFGFNVTVEETKWK